MRVSERISGRTNEPVTATSVSASKTLDIRSVVRSRMIYRALGQCDGRSEICGATKLQMTNDTSEPTVYCDFILHGKVTLLDCSRRKIVLHEIDS